ncbi:MAG: hypothetical protein B1H13_05080 [Desulfobacteraceae bacterium 4484_190.3]|nr:MAG: hypothetical protein B1H13_05080 [Desulfobacteraceae bacterium 4484_190.3]
MVKINRKKIRLFYSYDPVVIGYVVIGLIFSRIYNFEINWLILFDFKYDLVLLKVTSIALLIFLPLYYLGIRLKGKSGPLESIKASLIYMKDRFLNCASLFEFFRILAALKIVMTIHCTVKQAIPIINPALYDDILWKIDKFIHFGFSPTLLSLKLFSATDITSFIDFTYIIWYFLKIPFFIIFIWFVDQKKRDHFFSAYFLLWVIGGLSAVLFPSVGPVYKYPDLFAGLNIPHASELQKQLWIHYNGILLHPENFRAFVYEGVAAFPSLHVAVIALFCIFSRELNKIFFISMLCYTVIVQAGSVHLGWHYAVDGYFGVLLAFSCYFVTMRLSGDSFAARPGKNLAGKAVNPEHSQAT